MKKLLCTAAALAALSIPAQAQEMTMKPYVGIDLVRVSPSYTTDTSLGVALDGEDFFADNFDGLNIHVGNRFHKNFGMELGYFRTKEESQSFDISALTATPGDVANTKVRLQGFTLDGMGYLPLDKEEKFELIGTAGVSWTKADIKFSGIVLGVPVALSDDSSEFGFRAGGGAQFNFTNNVGVRGLARYQSADYDDTADRAWVYSVGLNYSF